MEEGRRPRRGRIALVGVSVSVSVTGCSSPSPPAPLARAIAAALGAADHAKAPWRCTAADLPELSKASFPHGWEVSAHTLRRAQAGDVTIAVVADTGGSAPPTVAALGRLRARLDALHVDLLISLGGIGASQGEVEASLGALADHAPYAVVALPGDLEATPAHAAAVASLAKRGASVVDGRLARWIELPDATIATLPGAGAAARLVAGDDGCAFMPADVATIYAELAARPGLRIAASAEAPRHITRSGPTGEPELVDEHLDVALAPGDAPSPPRSGGRDGAHVLLSPGIADATTRIPPTRGPTAGLLALHGKAWTYRPLVDTK